jgi:biopolymer transport protein ExbD
MKRALIIFAIVAAFVAGVAAHSGFTIYRSPTPQVPPAGETIPVHYPSPGDVDARYIVVTIPNDHEFYIGKSSLTLTDIPKRIRQEIGDLSPEQRTVFVKGEPSVRYDTLSAVIRTIRDAEVYRIEVVPIPKKPLQ